MNIDLLSKMVRELILENDRVVLPGLGVFVAEVVPASFSDKGYTLNPPYRRLHFRMRDDKDESLVSFYAESNNVSMDVARSIVVDFMVELRLVLQKNKVVIFPDLGRLRATKENNFFFVPDEDLDIYPEGFGLEPISLKTHKETREEVAAVMEDLADIMNEVAAEPAPDVKPLMEEHESGEVDMPGAGNVDEGSADAEELADGAVVPDSEEDVEEGVVPDVEDERGASEGVSLDGEGPADIVADEMAGVTASGDVKVEAGETDAADESRRSEKVRMCLMIAAGVVGLLVLALLVFLVLADACPDFIDSILYNKEELEILKRFNEI